MSWLVPRPASFHDTTRFVPWRLALAKMKCSFCAIACWAMRAKATKTSATTAILLFICCTSPHRDAASQWLVKLAAGWFDDGRAAVSGHAARQCLTTNGDVEVSRRSAWAVAYAPSLRARMTSMSAGRLQRARFSRPYGMASILIRRQVTKLLVSNKLLYRRIMYAYLAITAERRRDLLVRMLMHCMYLRSGDPTS